MVASSKIKNHWLPLQYRVSDFTLPVAQVAAASVQLAVQLVGSTQQRPFIRFAVLHKGCPPVPALFCDLNCEPRLLIVYYNLPKVVENKILFTKVRAGFWSQFNMENNAVP
jgi:hypothetical protein